MARYRVQMIREIMVNALTPAVEVRLNPLPQAGGDPEFVPHHITMQMFHVDAREFCVGDERVLTIAHPPTELEDPQLPEEPPETD